jgi:hypothetical protein
MSRLANDSDSASRSAQPIRRVTCVNGGIDVTTADGVTCRFSFDTAISSGRVGSARHAYAVRSANPVKGAERIRTVCWTGLAT